LTENTRSTEENWSDLTRFLPADIEFPSKSSLAPRGRRKRRTVGAGPVTAVLD
jgi:hypothetical protein